LTTTISTKPFILNLILTMPSFSEIEARKAQWEAEHIQLYQEEKADLREQERLEKEEEERLVREAEEVRLEEVRKQEEVAEIVRHRKAQKEAEARAWPVAMRSGRLVKRCIFGG